MDLDFYGHWVVGWSQWILITVALLVCWHLDPRRLFCQPSVWPESVQPSTCKLGAEKSRWSREACLLWISQDHKGRGLGCTLHKIALWWDTKPSARGKAVFFKLTPWERTIFYFSIYCGIFSNWFLEKIKRKLPFLTDQPREGVLSWLATLEKAS